MRAIYKYTLPYDCVAYLSKSLPSDYSIVQFGFQNEHPTIWAEVDTEAAETLAVFRICATGEELGEGWYYLGTADHGPYVWHLYQVPA